MIGKKKAIRYSKVSIVVLILNLVIMFNLINLNQHINLNNDYHEFQYDNINLFTSGLESYTLEWLDNGVFDLPVTEWYNETEGDTTDVNASLSDGFANLELLGDTGSFSSDDEVYPNQTGVWWTENNSRSYPVLPSTPRTENFGIDTEGWYCSHQFSETGQSWETDTNPNVEFKRNYTMGVDLADYSIIREK